MQGNERRNKIIQMLTESEKPISGKAIATAFDISRQVVVQDIALLRAQNYDIISTNRGYILKNSQRAFRVFKVFHTDEQTADEMNLIVDYGGFIEDVFIYHRVYGIVSAKMNIYSRNDVNQFMEDLKMGKSSLLKNVTSGYHYHTISAPTETILDLIQEKLQEKGYLAKLQDYEPIDFWKSEELEENK